MGEHIVSQAGIEEFLEEVGRSGSVLGLSSVQRLMDELGNIQDRLNIIHVAGTNGKGSLCAMVASVLKEAGYRVGAYTSPSVFGRREQYLVDGAPASEEEYLDIFGTVKEAYERIKAKGQGLPTLFEVETAAAFQYFYQKKCQIVLLEAGLGGAADATNIIRKPLVSVLMSISMDHMGVLGESLEEIAQVKSGIIKGHGQVVAVEPEHMQVRKAIEKKCEERHAALCYAKPSEAKGVHWEQGRLCFSYPGYGQLRLSMAGAYQVENGICAIKVIETLKGMGWEVAASQVRRGLEEARWEGRFSVLCREPLFLMDGAHNADAAKKLRETIKMGFTNGKIIYIIGVLADKEYGKILKTMLPLAWKVYTVTPNHPRALDGAVLAKKAMQWHSDAVFCRTVREAAVKAAACAMREGAVVLAFGSLSYLGELRESVKAGFKEI